MEEWMLKMFEVQSSEGSVGVEGPGALGGVWQPLMVGNPERRVNDDDDDGIVVGGSSDRQARQERGMGHGKVMARGGARAGIKCRQ
jgi:hypothetical protein